MLNQISAKYGLTEAELALWGWRLPIGSWRPSLAWLSILAILSIPASWTRGSRRANSTTAAASASAGRGWSDGSGGGGRSHRGRRGAAIAAGLSRVGLGGPGRCPLLVLHDAGAPTLSGLPLDTGVRARHATILVPEAERTMATEIEFRVQRTADVLRVIVEHGDGDDGAGGKTMAFGTSTLA
jgi:hypothetical protein